MDEPLRDALSRARGAGMRVWQSPGGSFTLKAAAKKRDTTVDLLSDGRLEVGLGAGWMTDDYTWTGIPHDRAGRRIDRMIESIEARVTFRVYSYTVMTFMMSYCHHVDGNHLSGRYCMNIIFTDTLTT